MINEETGRILATGPEVNLYDVDEILMSTRLALLPLGKVVLKGGKVR